MSLDTAKLISTYQQVNSLSALQWDATIVGPMSADSYTGAGVSKYDASTEITVNSETSDWLVICKFRRVSGGDYFRLVVDDGSSHTVIGAALSQSGIQTPMAIMGRYRFIQGQTYNVILNGGVIFSSSNPDYIDIPFFTFIKCSNTRTIGASGNDTDPTIS